MFLPFVFVIFCQIVKISHGQTKRPTLFPTFTPTFSPMFGSAIEMLNAGSYSFTIPSGVQYLVVDIYGAQGEDVPKASAQSYGGNGAHVRMTMTHFPPSQIIYVTVGSRGGSYGNPGAANTNGGNCNLGAGSGGGYSALFSSNNAIIVMAGGGGGGGDGMHYICLNRRKI